MSVKERAISYKPWRKATPFWVRPCVLYGALSLPGTLLAGCAHPVSTTAPGPITPPPAPAPPPALAPVVMTTYTPYQPMAPGQQTRSFSLLNITPGDNSVPAPGGPPFPAPPGGSPVAQGRVSLDDYQFHITPDGAGGSVLDGSVSVHNHGPYDITNFQVSLREAGRLYALIAPGAGHAVAPSQGTVYTVHAAVPLSMDALKTGKSFLLEAQIDGPPGLATDEESGTTVTSTVPGPPRP